MFPSLNQEIKDTLGVGGLTQQVRATDQQGRNLLMHAARYASSAEVFSSALELVKALMKPGVVKGLSQLETGASQLRQWDANGMNLLHHGAEGCAEEMLSAVRSTQRYLRRFSCWSRVGVVVSVVDNVHVHISRSRGK